MIRSNLRAGTTSLPVPALKALAISVPMLLCAGQARAEQPQAPPGQHQHDGFFLRLLVGPSYLLIAATEDGEDLSVGGYGATVQVALGYNLARNLILYGELFDDVTVSPTARIKGDDEEDELDATLGLYGVGIGLAYYLPRNVFISASAALSQLQAEYDEDGATVEWASSIGFGVNLVVGKEWWVSDDWALGGAIQVFLGSVHDDELGDSWAVGAVGLALSATYD